MPPLYIVKRKKMDRDEGGGWPVVADDDGFRNNENVHVFVTPLAPKSSFTTKRISVQFNGIQYIP